jgi:hypothetical protein
VFHDVTKREIGAVLDRSEDFIGEEGSAGNRCRKLLSRVAGIGTACFLSDNEFEIGLIFGRLWNA